jgi:hypothetical protein
MLGGLPPGADASIKTPALQSQKPALRGSGLRRAGLEVGSNNELSIWAGIRAPQRAAVGGRRRPCLYASFTAATSLLTLSFASPKSITVWGS